MCSSNSTWQQLGLQVTRNLQLPTCVPQAASTQQAKNATLTVTGAVSWRRPGLKYNKNEVFLDIVEEVNLLMSSTGGLQYSHAAGVDVSCSVLRCCHVCGVCCMPPASCVALVVGWFTDNDQAMAMAESAAGITQASTQ